MPRTPPLELPEEARKRAIASLRRYVAEELDVKMTDLKATLMLDYILADIAPAVYNQAIGDARAFFEERVADLPAVCQRDEFSYWGPARR
jgi:uncharacterized protein (DUF2164 family)